MFLTFFFALIFIAVGVYGYLLLNTRLEKRKYRVATVKRWWEEEYKEDNTAGEIVRETTRMKTLYDVEFANSRGKKHVATLTYFDSNENEMIQVGDEQYISYMPDDRKTLQDSIERVTEPDTFVRVYLALVFFGIYLLGFPLFNRVLVWLLSTTH